MAIHASTPGLLPNTPSCSRMVPIIADSTTPRHGPSIPDRLAHRPCHGCPLQRRCHRETIDATFGLPDGVREAWNNVDHTEGPRPAFVFGLA
jgi:hypothetical protein